MNDRIKPWEELTIKDDYMFKLVMRNRKICKKFLRRLFKMKIRKIRYIEEEKNIKYRYQGKGIRLDVYVADENDTVYNIEMQIRGLQGDSLFKRTRYYQSMIDTDLLAAGADYDALNPVILIFICAFDPFGKGRHIYTFRNRCIEDEEIELADGGTKIFLNTKGAADDVTSEMKAFLNYIEGALSDDELVREMQQEVEIVKTLEEERVRYMTYEMKMKEERKIGREEGRAVGAFENQLFILQNMLKMKLPLEHISQVMNLPISKIRALADEHGLGAV